MHILSGGKAFRTLLISAASIITLLVPFGAAFAQGVMTYNLEFSSVVWTESAYLSTPKCGVSGVPGPGESCNPSVHSYCALPNAVSSFCTGGQGDVCYAGEMYTCNATGTGCETQCVGGYEYGLTGSWDFGGFIKGTEPPGSVCGLTPDQDFGTWWGCHYPVYGDVWNSCLATVQVNCTAPANQAPTIPTITGPTTGVTNTPLTWNFFSTDPDGNQIRYGVSYNNNANINEWVPASGYVNSGTTQPFTFPGITNPGTYTFGVLAEDALALRSGFGTHTITISSAPVSNLIAGSVTPTTATTGAALTLSSTISNTGTASTGTGFTNLFQTATDDSGTGATDIGTFVRSSSLANGGTFSATLSHTFNSSGLIYVRACADKSSAGDTNGTIFPESNDNDNCGTWTLVTVGGVAPTADLSVSKSSAYVGEEVTLTWSSTNATSCEYRVNSGAWIPVSLSGSTPSTITEPVIVDFRCSNTAGTSPIDSVSISINSCQASIPANASEWDAEERQVQNNTTNWSYSSSDTTTKCQYSCSSGYSWNGSACTIDPSASLSITVSPDTYSETLPDSTASVTYSLTNGTGANTDCYLLNYDGTIVLATDLTCTSPMSVTAPAFPSTYGYSMRATKASTGETKEDAFTVIVNPAMAYQLSVTKAGTGQGIVTATPAGQGGALDCGSTCYALYSSGTTVTITATPSAGSIFSGWSGGGCSGTATTCTITISGAPNITATFTAIAPTATLSATSPVAYAGQSTLTWSSTNATSCTAGASPWNATLNGSGLTDPLTANTTFTFQCTGPGGTSALQSVTVTVGAPPTYSVSFNANGGTGTMTSQTKTHDVILTLTTNTFTRSGYTFNNWNTAANGSGTSYANGASYATNANVTLYAQWTVAQPNLTAGSIIPTIATTGVALTLSSTISNTGDATTGAGFTNLFQRATDASGTGATDIGTFVRSSSLVSGGTFSVTLSSYTFATSGTHYVRSCADKSSAGNEGVITESNDNDNCGSWTAIVVTDATNSLGINVDPTTYSVTLPSSTASVTYSLTNGTPANTTCRLLDNLGAPLTEYATCAGGSLSVTAPAIAGIYGYFIQAFKSSTGETVTSNSFTVTVNEGEDPICNNGAINPPACNVFLPTRSISVNPSSIDVGESATISWSSTNATSCTGTGFNTGGATSGSVSTGVISTPNTYNYQVVCSGPGGSSDPAFASLVVVPPGVVFTAPVTGGGGSGSGSTTVMLTWSANSVVSCSVTDPSSPPPLWSGNADGEGNVEDSKEVTVTKQTTFTITCSTGPSTPPVSKSITVNIAPLFQEF